VFGMLRRWPVMYVLAPLALLLALAFMPAGTSAASVAPAYVNRVMVPAPGLSAASLIADLSPNPGAVTSSGGSPAKLPPDLITLEQKMGALHMNSERGSLVEVLTGVSQGAKGLFEGTSSKPSRRHRKRSVPRRKPTAVRLTTHPKQSVPFLTADFEASVSPKLAVIRGEILGGLPFQERVIGEQVYTRSPFLAQGDHGKPWLYTSPAEEAEAKAKSKKRTAAGESSLSSELPGPESAESGFGGLIELLDHARSVIEVGPREVDGQQTIEFEAELRSAKLGGGSSSKTSKSVKKALRRSKLTLDLYLASDGLPVRTRLQTTLGKVGLSVVSDILATEIPVSVLPPPASETITEPELKKYAEATMEAHLTKRERRELKRFETCLKRHRSRGRLVGKRERKKIMRECPPPRLGGGASSAK
jgi:hypothetical protein